MTAFILRTVQQVRRFILTLAGLMFMVIPFALILSGTAFIVIVLGLGFVFAEIAWERLQWVRIKISKPKRGGQLW
jgi:hypothetical protein